MILNSVFCYSQNIEDISRIVLNSYISERNELKSESLKLLKTKLNEIATNYGVGGEKSDSRFIITANINVLTNDIIAGPPTIFAKNIELTFFIGDAVENKVFSSINMTLKGAGTSETKAFIDALKKINTKNENLKEFIENGKYKIINYYESNCDNLLLKAHSLASKGNYDEAIYELMQTPDVCVECYQKVLKTSNIIYKNKIDSEGLNLLNQAKTIWSTSPNKEGAMEIKSIILKIDKNSSSYQYVNDFTKRIESKINADEKEKLKIQEESENRKYRLALQKEQNIAELNKIRINAYKEIAIEYMRNKPKIYNYYKNIYW